MGNAAVAIVFTIICLALCGILFFTFDYIPNQKKSSLKKFYVKEQYIIADESLKIFYKVWKPQNVIFLTKEPIWAEEFESERLATEQLGRFSRAAGFWNEGEDQAVDSPQLKVWKQICQYRYEEA